MKTHSGAAAIAIMLITAMGVASVSHAGKPPPPPPPPPYNPQIAYITNQHNTININVSNADGTDAVSLYSLPSKSVLWNLKFAPTGNRIVFIENHNIKVLTFAVSAQGVTTTSITTLTSEPYNVLHVDVSPDGMELLFVEDTADPNISAVYVMSMAGGPTTQLSLSRVLSGEHIYGDAVWAHSNNRIAVLQGAAWDQSANRVEAIQVVDLDPTNNYSIVTLETILTNNISQLYQINRLESAHTADSLLFCATPTGSKAGVYRIDTGTWAVTGPIVPGNSASFSANDSTILFRGYDGTGDLFKLDVATNVVTQLIPKAAGGAPDFLP